MKQNTVSAWQRPIVAALIAMMLVCQVPTAAYADALGIEENVQVQEENSLDAVEGENDPSEDALEAEVESAPQDAADESEPSASDVQVVPATFNVSAQIIAPDAAGNLVSWANVSDYEANEGDTAEDLTRALVSEASLDATISVSEQNGASLDAMVSPYDGMTYEWNSPLANHYWSLFVNGEPSNFGMSSVELHEGDQVVWMYCAYGDELPAENDLNRNPVTVNPDAPRPDYEAQWEGFANGSTLGGAVTQAPSATTTTDVELAWNPLVFAGPGGTSDQIIVNNTLYVVHGAHLNKVNASVGTIEKTAELAVPMKYFCRIAYAGGLILVPLETGQIQAFTADTLECVWISEKPDTANMRETQALSSVVVEDGKVFCAFTDAGGMGLRICVNLADGSLMWSHVNGESMYYWAGAAAHKGNFVIGSELGEVSLIDGKTGKVLSSVELPRKCRTTVVSMGNDRFAVNTDGILNIVELQGTTLSLVGSYEFAKFSTSTPAVVDGLVFVGGSNGWRNELFAVINTQLDPTDSAAVVTSHVEGNPQSAILVSKQDNAYYAYFTGNAFPGGIQMVSYKDGVLSDAIMLFEPDEDGQQFSTASVIVDAQGTLYYTNDSGLLFAIKNINAPVVPQPEPQPEPKPEPQPEVKPEAETKPAPQPQPKPQTAQGAKTKHQSTTTSSIKPQANATQRTVDATDQTSDAPETAVDVIAEDADDTAAYATALADVEDAQVDAHPMWPTVMMAAGIAIAIGLVLVVMRKKSAHK